MKVEDQTFSQVRSILPYRRRINQPSTKFMQRRCNLLWAVLCAIAAQKTIVSDAFCLGSKRYQAETSPRRTCTLSTYWSKTTLSGWVQNDKAEWDWEEDDPAYLAASAAAAVQVSSSTSDVPVDGNEALKYSASATPNIPSGEFRPKQSLGQNFLKDGNTVAKIIRSFAKDATETIKMKSDGKTMIEGEAPGIRAVELGPGPGALTDPLVETFGTDDLQCVEIDPRSVEMLEERHPSLRVRLEDVMQTDYPALSEKEGGPLSVVGNLPYYITSQILFALADASHTGAVRSATVTMQYEVAERIVSLPRCKAYGILSVVFQLYADCQIHFKIPPTVFYPQPKVDSALVGLRFIGPTALRQRLCGVRPGDIRRVLTATFQQRRKTVRNGLKKLAIEVCSGDKEAAKVLLASAPLPLPKQVFDAKENGDEFALGQELPQDWASKRPEELSPGQFVELTRLMFGNTGDHGDGTPKPLGKKVWRKLKHGKN